MEQRTATDGAERGLAVDGGGGRETECGDRSGAGRRPSGAEREGERTERRHCRDVEAVGQEPGGGHTRTERWSVGNREEALPGRRH